ncbi:melanoma-associated antigen B1-like [Oryctolagus cuniculus]|uniref:MAGE domain-containing protein n=1 Tax=Oryctolagus cuniculus TaxID=9986 RepID=G1TUY8_RABIT
MPRGQKSKLRARKKRQQTRSVAQGAKAAHAVGEEEEESPSSSPVREGTPPSSPRSCAAQGGLRGRASSSPEAGSSDASSDVDEGYRAGSSQVSLRDPLNRKASMLVQFIMEKYKKREPIVQADMLKVVKRKYKKHFPEILRRTSERVELIFGLELEEVDPISRSYVLINKLSLSSEDEVSGERVLPKTGLVMTLLAVIFMKGNRATEAEMWEFLNARGIYAGRRHSIFGEPRKLITEDLVQENYLEYRQVRFRSPPVYEFVWGPRAHAETTKMKVLEVLAKINDTVPRCYPDLYEEALRDEQERAELQAVARASTVARSRVGSRAKSRRSSHT